MEKSIKRTEDLLLSDIDVATALHELGIVPVEVLQKMPVHFKEDVAKKIRDIQSLQKLIDENAEKYRALRGVAGDLKRLYDDRYFFESRQGRQFTRQILKDLGLEYQFTHAGFVVFDASGITEKDLNEMLATGYYKLTAPGGYGYFGRGVSVPIELFIEDALRALNVGPTYGMTVEGMGEGTPISSSSSFHRPSSPSFSSSSQTMPAIEVPTGR